MIKHELDDLTDAVRAGAALLATDWISNPYGTHKQTYAASIIDIATIFAKALLTAVLERDAAIADRNAARVMAANSAAQIVTLIADVERLEASNETLRAALHSAIEQIIEHNGEKNHVTSRDRIAEWRKLVTP